MQGSFAGIGSRQTTHNIALMLYRLGCAFALRNMTCLTGGAPGSDDAFEKGVRLGYDLLSGFDNSLPPLTDYLKVFLPWDGFNYRRTTDPVNSDRILPKAYAIASEYHSAWKYLGEDSPVKALMARNSHQVFNDDLNAPIRFVFCYTEDGVHEGDKTTTRTGGTGQAIRVASAHGIPVYNIGNPTHYKRAEAFIEQVFSVFGAKLGHNLYELTEHEFLNYMPFQRHEKGSLIESAIEGRVEGIIHGMNCMNAMGSGFAKQIRSGFPEAYQADCQTKKGDRKKLGSFSHGISNRNGRDIIVVNAYTQFDYGRDDKLRADYKKIQTACRSIRKKFPHVTFGIPRIGTGLANGSWLTLSDILANELGTDNTVLFSDSEPSQELEPVPEQAAFDI